MSCPHDNLAVGKWKGAYAAPLGATEPITMAWPAVCKQCGEQFNVVTDPFTDLESEARWTTRGEDTNDRVRRAAL